MFKGLKVAIGVLAVGCIIPIVTMIFTLRNIPVYHTIQPNVSQEECFVQYTWQETPVLNLEHLLIFLEKPADYISHDGVDMLPPEKTDGYYVLPRGVFYKNGNILASMQKVFRMAKKDVRVWIIIKGKAFPVHLSKEELIEVQSLVASEKDHLKVDSLELGKNLLKSSVWAKISQDVKTKRQQLAEGKLDLKPHKRRSNFMR
jgi:hypothetical protein